MSLIVCKNVRLSYEGVPVLTDLNFTVERGDYLCVIGENGSGKSTLMKALLGLKAPDGGEIRFGDGLTRDRVGYLPQGNGIRRDFPASVWEIVLSGAQNTLGLSPFYGRAARATARKNLARLGIESLARRSFRELSGGQQQRVLLCRALCAGDQLLLLDEPATGLDPLVTAELYALIQEANRAGLTVVTVTHDLSVLRSATRVLHLAGKPLYFGDPEGWRNSTPGRALLGGERDV